MLFSVDIRRFTPAGSGGVSPAWSYHFFCGLPANSCYQHGCYAEEDYYHQGWFHHICVTYLRAC